MTGVRPFSVGVVAKRAGRTLGPALLGTLLLMCNACAGSGIVKVGDGGGAGKHPATVLSVAELLHGTASLNGETVTVQGRFAGWSGGCAGGAPRSRSDWMLIQQDGSTAACVYVSGALPSGVSAPPDTVSNGQPLTLRGRVERSEDGRLFLHLNSQPN
jgi:hypothetical protein